MFDSNLPARLRTRLSQPLPGRDAQRPFAHKLSYGRHFGPPKINARKAAVLVLLYRDDEQWVFALTRKQQNQGIHSGQICFAGGGLEPGETDIDAALRECHEETGWAPPETAVVGRLSPLYVYASNNLVSCIVAATTESPTWDPDQREVAELIPVPVRPLVDDEHVHFTSFQRYGLNNQARCFRWKSYDIWGATSMMIAELIASLQPSAPSSTPLFNSPRDIA